MDEDDPKRETKIIKYETADKEQAEARTELEKCIKVTMKMMKKSESFNQNKINNKIKQYNKGRCGRKAALKWIKRRLEAREQVERPSKGGLIINEQHQMPTSRILGANQQHIEI